MFLDTPVGILCGCSIRVNRYMCGNRFESIFSDLNIISTPPIFRDKLCEVIQMINSYNDHMQRSFMLSWISCLYGSIYLSVGPASETPKLIHYRVVLFHTPDIGLIDL